MDERATGIVLRLHPLTETSVIVRWLTAEAGRIATVAKGARRAKSPFRGLLDLFYLCDLSLTRSRRSDLHTLREVRLRDAHPALRTDLGWLRQAAYGAALVEQTTEIETPLPAIFALFRDLLEALSRCPPQALTIFAFEMKLLAELGLSPNLAQANLSAGARVILERCLGASWPELFQVKLSSAQTAELGRFLHGFLVYHLSQVPPGRAAALEG
jgi:DNA repair protein RecO (recombination protein O)